MDYNNFSPWNIGDYFLYDHPNYGKLIGVITEVDKNFCKYKTLFNALKYEPAIEDKFYINSIWGKNVKKISKETVEILYVK